MKCPKCKGKTRVLDTREELRRRVCESCKYAFFTIEAEIDYNEGLDRQSAFFRERRRRDVRRGDYNGDHLFNGDPTLSDEPEREALK